MTFFGSERSAFVFYIAYSDLENFVLMAVGAGIGAAGRRRLKKASTTGAEAAQQVRSR